MVKKIPERSCIGCRGKFPKRELIRIVRTPESGVKIDPTGKQNGRGAYICPKLECLELAFKGDRLGRALNAEVSKEIFERLKEELANR
ncbi:MAG TPA: YlxR family protein [Bacillota bacterium]|nr:YlxR family protein [Bacillota bacterium]